MLVPVDPSCLRTMTRVFLFAALVAVAGACYCDPTNGQQVSKFVKCMICDPTIHGTTACPRAGIMFVRHMHRYIDPVTKMPYANAAAFRKLREKVGHSEKRRL